MCIRDRLYAGLPKAPRISPVVEIWKGFTKYAVLTVMGLVAAAGFVHHAVMGANRVTAHDEDEGKKIKEGQE